MERTARPETGEKTTAPAIVVGGYPFHAYKVGIGQYERRCEALDAVVKVLGKDTYAAVVNGSKIVSSRTGKPQRFRSQHAAMKAIVKAKSVE